MDTTWLSSNGDFCFGKYLNKFIINVSTILRKKKTEKKCLQRRIPCGRNFQRVLILAIIAFFPAIRKNKFPQIKITANIFRA